MKTKEDFKVGDKVVIISFEFLEEYNQEKYFYKMVEVIESTEYTPEDSINVNIPHNSEGGLNVPISYVRKYNLPETKENKFSVGDKVYKPKGYKFSVGDKVYKPKGYKFNGTIVSVFKTTKNETRVVAELDECSNSGGMLHIFNEDQLELRVFEEKDCIKCNCK